MTARSSLECLLAIAALSAWPLAKCDAMAGDTKAVCVAAAKARFGKI